MPTVLCRTTVLHASTCTADLARTGGRVELDAVLLGGGASGCLQQGSHQLPEHHPGAGQGAACRCQQYVAASRLATFCGRRQGQSGQSAMQSGNSVNSIGISGSAARPAALAVGSSQSALDQWSRRWARRQRRRRCRRASSVGSGSKTSERPA
eukprot:COSAG06_NODE_1077_length_10804_cov_4.912751_6_plen_153_part_00